jgi:hypothetical protein
MRPMSRYSRWIDSSFRLEDGLMNRPLLCARRQSILPNQFAEKTSVLTARLRVRKEKARVVTHLLRVGIPSVVAGASSRRWPFKGSVGFSVSVQ